MRLMVITGASSGVGRATALRFASEGYAVCALARSANKLDELVVEAVGKIYPYPTDVSDSQAVERTFAKILEEHGKIDVLVNNAGVTTGGRPIDFAMIDRIIDTNLKGTLYCTFAALPSMRQNGGGHIVNVASIAGVNISAQGDDGLYIASKHGVVAHSEALGRLVRRDGVLVTALCPGGIDTPLWNDENPYPYDEGMMIQPEEVADLIAYILAQPKRTLFKNVIFVPVVEQW
ncbi:MAG TPA: SDR family oxidoreductase [Thermoflexia bacterium]|nr:SDR family oxidoreductase [Thermoflexia bacterium]